MVEVDCEKSMNSVETSPKVTKSKRSLHWCRSITKTLSVQFLLQYQSKSYYIIRQEVYYSIGRFYYIIGHLLHYRAFFITLWMNEWMNESLFNTITVRYNHIKNAILCTINHNGHVLQYRAYYSIGRLLQYRLVQLSIMHLIERFVWNFMLRVLWAILHWIRRFAKVNANTGNCLLYRINSSCKLFLSMYTSIILTRR